MNKYMKKCVKLVITKKWWALINTGRDQTSVSAKHWDIINKTGKCYVLKGQSD